MLIRLRDIKKKYLLGSVSLEVLRGIDFDVEKKDFVAVMGRSGSGKSTLLNITGCLDRQTSGAYFFDGNDIAGRSDNELAELRNKEFGFVFQTFNLLPRYSAYKNVEIPMLYTKLSQAERESRAMEVLERTGIINRKDHTPAELSGGEQQRVAIARALVMRPTVLLADEPTGNLDSRSSFEIIEIFKKLNEEGITVILVTHETDIAREAKRIVTIRDGVLSGNY